MRVLDREETWKVAGGLTKDPQNHGGGGGVQLPPVNVPGWYPSAPLLPGEIVTSNYHQPGVGVPMGGGGGGPYAGQEFSKLSLPFTGPDGSTYYLGLVAGLKLDGHNNGNGTDTINAHVNVPLQASNVDLNVSLLHDQKDNSIVPSINGTVSMQGFTAAISATESAISGSGEWLFGRNNEFVLGLAVRDVPGQGLQGMLTIRYKGGL